MSKLVVIDPGHGGHDPGALGNGLRECDLTLKIGKRIKAALLRDYDVDVKLTRSDDHFVGLKARAKFANDRSAAYFVAVHINSGGGTGYEDFVQPGSGATTRQRRKQLHEVIAAFMDQHDLVDRGMKSTSLAVLRLTAMPAVLTESLFIDRPSDAHKLADDAFLKGLAEAHARGIATALNLPRVSVPVG